MRVSAPIGGHMHRPRSEAVPAEVILAEGRARRQYGTGTTDVERMASPHSRDWTGTSSATGIAML